MKKVLFLQNENALGGVWYVNKSVAEALVKKGYDVSIVSIRNSLDKKLKCDKNIKLDIINNDSWDLMRKKDVIMPLKKLKLISFLKNIFKYYKSHSKLKNDYKKLKQYIILNKPDYIIASHYQTLYGIPNVYLSKTLYEHHASFDFLNEAKDNFNVLKKYNGKIYGYIWLSKAALNKALKNGFNKSFCIYNPVRFNCEKKANVIQNKKIVVITRIENYNKRINLMIEMVNDVFKDKAFKNWSFDIYGLGEFDLESKKIINNNNQINYKGVTDNPKEVLLNSSISLNTSIFEGFSMSILESTMCGIPTVTFNHGESINEEVLKDKTGYVIKQNDKKLYKEKLMYLMNDEDTLKKFSNNCKEYSNNFLIENIINKWIDLFKEMEKNDEN